MNVRSRGDKSVSGGAHLERRSGLVKRIRELGLELRLLIVEDKSQDAHFISKPLSRLFGELATIVVAPTVSAMKAALTTGAVSAIVLDDNMDAGATAMDTLPMIRAAGYTGPVLLVSGLLTNTRRAELKRLGFAVILAKDELDSVELGERLLQALGHPM